MMMRSNGKVVNYSVEAANGYDAVIDLAGRLL